MKIEINVPGRNPDEAEIKFDGKIVPVMGISFHLGQERMPEVVVELDVIEGIRISADCDVHIPDYTADLLKKCGWTPPPNYQRVDREH